MFSFSLCLDTISPSLFRFSLPFVLGLPRSYFSFFVCRWLPLCIPCFIARPYLSTSSRPEHYHTISRQMLESTRKKAKTKNRWFRDGHAALADDLQCHPCLPFPLHSKLDLFFFCCDIIPFFSAVFFSAVSPNSTVMADLAMSS